MPLVGLQLSGLGGDRGSGVGIGDADGTARVACPVQLLRRPGHRGQRQVLHRERVLRHPVRLDLL